MHFFNASNPKLILTASLICSPISKPTLKSWVPPSLKNPASMPDFLTCSLPPKSARNSRDFIVILLLVLPVSVVVVVVLYRVCFNEIINKEWARVERSFMWVAARRFCRSPAVVVVVV